MSEFTNHEPHPFDRKELFENDPVFAEALRFQDRIANLRFDMLNDAVENAFEFAERLDDMIRNAPIMNEGALLIGPDVCLPSISHDTRTGALSIEMQNALDDPAASQAAGEFFGFVGYAVEAEDGESYRPIIGVQLTMVPITAPNFRGRLTAYGPVASTTVQFMADEYRKLMSGNLF